MYKKVLLALVFTFLLLIPSSVYAANKTGYNNAVNLTVRKTASTSGSKVGVLPIGTNIEILGTASGNGCKTWYKFKYDGSDAWACGITTGGVEYIKTYTTTTLRTNNRNPSTAYEKELQAAGFPSSYWDKLSALHAMYPNWTFVANKTNLDFNTAVSKEVSDVETNLIQVTSSNMAYMAGYLSTASGSYNYKTNKFTGTLIPSDEGEVFWVPLNDMPNMNLPDGMGTMLRIFCEDIFTELFFYKENGEWVEVLK